MIVTDKSHLTYENKNFTILIKPKISTINHLRYMNSKYTLKIQNLSQENNYKITKKKKKIIIFILLISIVVSNIDMVFAKFRDIDILYLIENTVLKFFLKKPSLQVKKN